MGESVPAADITEIQDIVGRYFSFNTLNLVSAEQVDLDATIFRLNIDGNVFYLLEEDYISNLEWVLNRFHNYGLNNPQLQEVIDPPEAFDYVPYVKAKPEYFTNENDDFNRLRLFQTDMQPKKLHYSVRYYLARQVEA